jgi:hypothetical protein
MAQTNRGIFIQVMPGARRVWVVTMKFRPVRIDEKPNMKTPNSTGASAAGVLKL